MAGGISKRITAGEATTLFIASSGAPAASDEGKNTAKLNDNNRRSTEALLFLNFLARSLRGGCTVLEGETTFVCIVACDLASVLLTVVRVDVELSKQEGTNWVPGRCSRIDLRAQVASIDVRPFCEMHP